jgi:hypothetical protein
VFTVLCNHHPYLFAALFHHPKSKLYTNSTIVLHFLLYSVPDNLYSIFCLYKFAHYRYFMEVAIQNLSFCVWRFCCRQRQEVHQSFWEASLLNKLAATPQTRVQRLSIKNKGGFPYIPFRAGYRGEGAACPIHKHMSFHWPL